MKLHHCAYKITISHSELMQKFCEFLGSKSLTTICDVNTIANYDPSIIPYLDSVVGTKFEKESGASDFVLVED